MAKKPAATKKRAATRPSPKKAGARSRKSSAPARSSRKKYVYLFANGKADGDRTMEDLLGGKGSGLAEMTNAGLPVPPGFTITTEACNLWYANHRHLPKIIEDEMLAAVRRLEQVTGAEFGSTENPLLVSVRSGAKFSMPSRLSARTGSRDELSMRPSLAESSAFPAHTLSVADVCARLHSTAAGLTGAEAGRRLIEHGPNELRAAPRTSPWTILLEQFRHVLIVVLLVATALSGLLGHVAEAVAITLIVVFSVLLGFVQEYRADRAIEALREMAAPTAPVLRDGEETDLPARDLVPGDVVVLRSGNRIPADARLEYASCKFTPLSDDKGSMFGTFECMGITRSNQENKVFETMSLREVGFFNNVGAQSTAFSYTKYMDPDGDLVMMKFSESGPTEQREGTWEILYGTGKWKGINGSDKHVHVSRGKPIKPDTVQGSIVRNTGTFELPK